MSPRQVGKTRVRVDFPRTAHNAVHRNQSGYAMEVEALIKTALREAFDLPPIKKAS